MPNTDSEGDNEEVVFLSPDESPPKNQDPGASPKLRRSSRKRKSVSNDMSKGSGSKKKKTSPIKATEEQVKNMPRVARSPQGTQRPQAEQPLAEQPGPTDSRMGEFERMLLAMESRLSSKIEATNKAVNEAVAVSKMTNDALELLEEKVDSNDASLRDLIAENQEKVMDVVKDNIKDMVNEQLRSAGFDPELTAGLMETPAVKTPAGASYASALATVPRKIVVATGRKEFVERDRTDRREDKFWECRKSLRLWPVAGEGRGDLEAFLVDKLRMDRRFVQEEMGEVKIRKHRDPRSKVKDEVIVEFECKEVRDAIKAQGPNLANFREEAGMRLHLPNHLQKDFRALMGLSYELKKKNPDLRRNVKFDEGDLGLFMDIQISKDGRWRQIKPEQAKLAYSGNGQSDTGPQDMDVDELASLLGTSGGVEGSGAA